MPPNSLSAPSSTLFCSGQVFVDVEGTRDRVLELTGACAGAEAVMGGTLAAPAGGEVRFQVRVQALAGARIDIVMDGTHQVALAGAVIATNDQTLDFALPADGARHWLRADIRSADGARTLMIGNPIYLNH
jgi:hypothetical protein